MNSIILFFTAFLFYGLGTNVLRLHITSFSMPLFFIGIFVYFIFNFGKIKFNKNISTTILLIILYLIIYIISGLINNSDFILDGLIKYLLCIFTLLTAYLIAQNMNEEKLFTWLKVLVIFSSVFCIIHILYYYFYLHAYYLSASLDILSEIGKNQIANYLGALFVLSVFLIINENKKLWRYILLFPLLIHFVGLLYTFSRSALIGSIFAIIVFLILSKNNIYKKIFNFRVIFITLLIGMILIYFIPKDFYGIFIENIDSIITFQDPDDSTSITVRSELIAQGFQMFTEKPFLGNGPGFFVKNIGVATHNSYIQLLAETGILGCVSYFLILIIPILVFQKNLIANITKPVILFIILSLIFLNALDSIIIYFFLGLLCGSRKFNLDFREL